MKRVTGVTILLMGLTLLSGLAPLGANQEEPEAEGATLSGLAGAVRGLSLAVAGWWDAFAGPGADAEPEERERLVRLSAKLSRILALQRVDILRAIDQYVEAPSAAGWQEIQFALGTVVVELDELLGDLEGEQSDFVLRQAYPELLRTVRTRSGIARNLRSIPRPKSPTELRELRQIQAEYVLLVGNLELAIAELNAFIEGIEE